MFLSPEPHLHPQSEQYTTENNFGYCIERIDLLFQQHYLLCTGEPPALLQPYFWAENEIEQRLSSPQGEPLWASLPGVYLPATDEMLSQRLQTLVTAFDLTVIERDILLTGLLPRLSDHYARLPESGLQAGITEHLLVQLFARSQTEFRLLQSALHPTSPLLQFQLLIRHSSDRNKLNSPVFVVHESLWHFFCGENSPVTGWYSCTRWMVPDNIAWYPPSLYEAISRLTLSPHQESMPVIVLEGHEQDGRERALTSILADQNHSMLCLNAQDLTELPLNKQQQAIRDIVREALLCNAGLMLENSAGMAAAATSYQQTLISLLQRVQLPLFILTDTGTDTPELPGLPCIHLTMTQPAAAERAALLQAAWPTLPEDKNQQALLILAQRYTFSPADISVLIQEADCYRQIRNENARLNSEDIRQALVCRSRQNFGKLAQRITPTRTFDDLILSPALKTQLQEIIAAIRFQESVTKQHFYQKTGGETGISALFYGDSGTGKTLAAEVLAQHTGVDLIKVDLSTVVNKYVGETEKNLARIFDLAQADSGILFFDEADALFGKRSETKDAQDRHANIEVSYLLQRLENYPGLVILATNNRNHLDSAFNRRFTFITRFTYPDVTLRSQMWRAAWPATLKLADDVDFSALAARAELTGANIGNAALLAAILAAEENCAEIQPHHIEHAIKRELSKLGRLSL